MKDMYESRQGGEYSDTTDNMARRAHSIETRMPKRAFTVKGDSHPMLIRDSRSLSSSSVVVQRMLF